MKKWKIIIRYFNPKTFELKATETCTTRPMEEKEFQLVLKNRLVGLKNFCYEVK